MINHNFGGICLGPLKESNLLYYLRNRNNIKIWAYTRQNDLLQEKDHKKWFENLDSSKDKMYEILLNSANYHNQLIGVCGLTYIDWRHRRGEFSIWIDPDYQGQSHGKNVLLTLFKHGFYTLNLNRIWGESFDTNPANKLFEALGMEKEGTRKEFYFKNGNYIDAHLWSINRMQYDNYVSHATCNNGSTEEKREPGR